MNCTNPILAVRLYKPLLGKSSIKILPRRVDMGVLEYSQRYGSSNILELPCGHCPSCLARRSKEWSVRCALESLDHQKSCFVTLTYDDDHYGQRDVKNDWKKFIKSLRNDGHKLRYFGCCETGDRFGRQHFHIILFGYMPDDLCPWAKSQSKVQQYLSNYLLKVWNKGIVTVAEFSPFAAQYVAGYVVKKMRYGDDGSFHFQSTRPGIGAGYVMRNIQDIYEQDKLILSFGNHLFSVPRYFDKLAEAAGMDLTDIKAKRFELANMMSSESMKDLGLDCRDRLLLHNESVALSNIRFKKRSF